MDDKNRGSDTGVYEKMGIDTGHHENRGSDTWDNESGGNAGLLGKFISLVFGKKGYQEAFPFPSGTGSRSFKNIKITETSKSIAWKQVVCFTCTPFKVNWITCLCRRTYLQK